MRDLTEASRFPLFGILTVVFVILKAIGLITWPWWLVFLPLWGPWALILALVVVVLLIMGLVFGAAWVIDQIQPRKLKRA